MQQNTTPSRAASPRRRLIFGVIYGCSDSRSKWRELEASFAFDDITMNFVLLLQLMATETTHPCRHVPSDVTKRPRSQLNIMATWSFIFIMMSRTRMKFTFFKTKSKFRSYSPFKNVFFFAGRWRTNATFSWQFITFDVEWFRPSPRLCRFQSLDDSRMFNRYVPVFRVFETFGELSLAKKRYLWSIWCPP